MARQAAPARIQVLHAHRLGLRADQRDAGARNAFRVGPRRHGRRVDLERRRAARQIERHAVDEIGMAADEAQRLVGRRAPESVDRVGDQAIMRRVVRHALAMDHDRDHRRRQHHQWRKDERKGEQPHRGGARHGDQRRGRAARPAAASSRPSARARRSRPAPRPPRAPAAAAAPGMRPAPAGAPARPATAYRRPRARPAAPWRTRGRPAPRYIRRRPRGTRAPT